MVVYPRRINDEHARKNWWKASDIPDWNPSLIKHWGSTEKAIVSTCFTTNMAGHSKWSKVKRSKGVLDVRRGKLFSRLSKEITVAAKLGGADPAFNPRLRTAILMARTQNMPNENIDRALKKGDAEDGGSALEELVYEAYAPGGVALIIETATDNRNRTAADIRLILSKNHGNLASSGSVSYMFHRRGRITVPAPGISEERLLEVLLEAGGDEWVQDEEQFIILTPPDKLYAVAEALKASEMTTDSIGLTFVPENTVPVADEAIAAQVLKLHDALDDNEDVLNVFSNFDIPEEILTRIAN